jgi:hypothetical protein
LQFNDKVIEINGIDLLDKGSFLDECMKWSVGEKARVTFIRAGEKQTLQVELVPNIR